ncbi:MAG: hypothetical protein AB2L16_08535 [Anaerolineaceae bacterium]
MKWWYFLVLLVAIIGTVLWLNWGLFDHTQDNNIRKNNNNEIMVKPTALFLHGPETMQGI